MARSPTVPTNPQQIADLKNRSSCHAEGFKAVPRCSTTSAWPKTATRNSTGTVLAALPGGNCRGLHWGYVLTGRLTVRYGDHEEVIEPGDAFCMIPGHTPEAVDGTEFVMFSPSKELAAVDEALKKGVAPPESNLSPKWSLISWPSCSRAPARPAGTRRPAASIRGCRRPRDPRGRTL